MTSIEAFTKPSQTSTKSECTIRWTDNNALLSSRLARLGPNDTSRQNSANASGFGRNISRWAERKTVLPDNVLSLPLVGKNKGHPAVFPVELPAFFIRLLAPKNGLVIDPFAGSGTTAIAAFQEGRSCVLIDNNWKYCRQAAERLRSECGLVVPHLPPVATHRGKRVGTQTWSTICRADAHQLAA